MSGLLWKVPGVVILALLAAAANLVTHVRARATATSHIQLPAALRAPPDGLARAKSAAAEATETAALRAAIETFVELEGRPPESLTELVATGYLQHTHASLDLRRFRYDPQTVTLTCHAR